jgi:hypothetical protein
MSEGHGTLRTEDVAAWSRGRAAAAGTGAVDGATRLTGEQAVAKLPASIRVGPFDYAIERMTSNQSASMRRWGEFSSMESVIRVSTNFPTAVKAVDTLLHEVGHAIWFAWGIEKGDDEERVVGNAAMGWVTVYRNNPWLLGWIAECLA